MWIITKDHLNEVGSEYNRVDVRSHQFVTETRIRETGKLERFRLSDDDGEVYFEGVRTADDDGCLDWAMADAGCTQLEIEVAARGHEYFETVIS